MPPCFNSRRMLAFLSFFIAFTTALPTSEINAHTETSTDAGSEADIRQAADELKLFHTLQRSTLAPEALTIAFFLLLAVLLLALAAALPKLCTLLVSVVAQRRTDETLERWRVEREVLRCERDLMLMAAGLGLDVPPVRLPGPPPPYTPRPPAYSDEPESSEEEEEEESGKVALPSSSQGGDP
ncbi:hypothetical protein FB45DRAFT_906544 [Roridomyces roridus]|uniref:Transmembrane protein n=1 Tax=Roridomyces roridus TaxID=1738132 RepID=A0AAD7FS65_9AGAR|nr:hypothetical protein FB45DRAFT_906544 [Roridomyces roridus]